MPGYAHCYCIVLSCKPSQWTEPGNAHMRISLYEHIRLYLFLCVFVYLFIIINVSSYWYNSRIFNLLFHTCHISQLLTVTIETQLPLSTTYLRICLTLEVYKMVSKLLTHTSVRNKLTKWNSCLCSVPFVSHSWSIPSKRCWPWVRGFCPSPLIKSYSFVKISIPSRGPPTFQLIIM